MIRPSIFTRGVLTALIVAVVAGCDDSPQLVSGPPPVAPNLLASYVALGNSITAGFQSAGINDSTQRESYAALFAHQAGTRFAIPALAFPGCPPPLNNFQLQTRVGGAPAGTCALREKSSITDVLNNVAVPGATVIDPTQRVTSTLNQLTLFVLGGQTQVERALQAHPTFASVWIGNNDVLDAALSGILVPAAGISRGVTPVTTFTATYDNLINRLLQGASAAGEPLPRTGEPQLLGGVLIGIVDVTNAPLLFPAAALFNPTFKAGFDQFAGQTTTLLPSCTPSTKSLINFQLAGAIRLGQHPATIGCEPNSIPGTPVGDLFVLDSAEIETVSATVAEYNAHIESLAEAKNFAFVDPNPLLFALRMAGQIPIVPDLASATAPFGDYISLDGIHPRALAHVEIARSIILAVNDKYGTDIPVTGIPLIVP